jgi:hypothetical protein
LLSGPKGRISKKGRGNYPGSKTIKGLYITKYLYAVHLLLTLTAFPAEGKVEGRYTLSAGLKYQLKALADLT